VRIPLPKLRPNLQCRKHLQKSNAAHAPRPANSATRKSQTTLHHAAWPHLGHVILNGLDHDAVLLLRIRHLQQMTAAAAAAASSSSVFVVYVSELQVVAAALQRSTTKTHRLPVTHVPA
jgi:hypothetical protein